MPLIDGGTVRLPRLIGAVPRDGHDPHRTPGRRAEALDFGLANRVVPNGEESSAPRPSDLARDLARFPQTCMREDRLSPHEQDGLDEAEPIANEVHHGMRSLADVQPGLERFRAGAGRHGSFEGLGGFADARRVERSLSNLRPGDFRRGQAGDLDLWPPPGSDREHVVLTDPARPGYLDVDFVPRRANGGS